MGKLFSITKLGKEDQKPVMLSDGMTWYIKNDQICYKIRIIPLKLSFCIPARLIRQANKEPGKEIDFDYP